MVKSPWPVPDYNGHPSIGMSGTCGIPNGATQSSWFLLNRCYDNLNGTLQAVDGYGNFYETCRNCNINSIDMPGTMICQCDLAGNDKPKKNVTASVDLSMCPVLCRRGSIRKSTSLLTCGVTGDHIVVHEDGLLGCPGVKGLPITQRW